MNNPTNTNLEKAKKIITARKENIQTSFAQLAHDIYAKKCDEQIAEDVNTALLSMCCEEEPEPEIPDETFTIMLQEANMLVNKYAKNNKKFEYNPELTEQMRTIGERALDETDIPTCNPFFTENNMPCMLSNTCGSKEMCPCMKLL